MKVAKNDETNPSTQSIRLPHVPSIVNMQQPTSVLSVRKCQTPGILSRMFSPFAGITYYRDWAHLASRFVMSCIIMHLFALYLLFLPPLLSLDTETDAAATQYDYGVDDPSFSAELPGKPPLDHQISPIPSLYCLH